MKIRNSDFWILATIVAVIAGLGVYQGSELHPAFYSQPVILFGGLAFLACRGFYLDKKNYEIKNQ
ncbi:MAG: hypothetical protein E6K85_09895 [Thaumarchaeota archaeon]|nr:MAG: hypothetical protein E6K85_09895 [Nitrososphaerota archaeon]